MTAPVKSLIVFLCFFSFNISAQTDSVPQSKRSSKWYVPDGVTLQYAGGFGMLSAGAIYQPSKRSEINITAGYTPSYFGNIWTANLFGSYTPITIKPTSELSLYLLKSGLFVNFNFGKNIYLIWPSYYPENYYWWNSSMRFGPFINTELKYAPEKSLFTYTFMFHCNTNDLYLASYLTNIHTIHLHDILVFGLGIKVMQK